MRSRQEVQISSAHERHTFRVCRTATLPQSEAQRSLRQHPPQTADIHSGQCSGCQRLASDTSNPVSARTWSMVRSASCRRRSNEFKAKLLEGSDPPETLEVMRWSSQGASLSSRFPAKAQLDASSNRGSPGVKPDSCPESSSGIDASWVRQDGSASFQVSSGSKSCEQATGKEEGDLTSALPSGPKLV